MTPWTPGSQSPTVQSARNQVRIELRDGLPALDATPVPFELVRLESLQDQITATPGHIFQLRFENVPLERFATVNAIPGTLVAFVDGSWAPTLPVQDVDQNGNFTLPVAPVSALLVTYGWQFFTDTAIDNYVDQARQWLRQFQSVSMVPDGLNPALVHYAAGLALSALARQLTLSAQKAGTAEIDLSDITKAYQAQAAALIKLAGAERDAYYSRGSEALDPTAVDVSSVGPHNWSPQR